jgi:hypothetical protein
MSAAHSVTWWGSLDPYTFGCWFSEDQIFSLPNAGEVDRLLLLSFVTPAGDQHRDYVRSLPSSRDRVTAYMAFTAYAHEWRHWYDATSTPFGISRTAQLAGIFATASHLENEIQTCKKLFVPLSRWVRNVALIALAHPELEKPSSTICKTVEFCRMLLQKADFGLRGTSDIGNATVSTSQILEGLAMLSQEQAAEKAFGKEAATEIRNSIKQSDEGKLYYTAVDLLEERSKLPTACQIKILEASLFVNYGVLGSMSKFTPPMLFSELLQRGNFNHEDQLEGELDRLLFEAQGFDRISAHGIAYEVASKQYERILQSAALGQSGAQFRRILATALKSACLVGGAARFHDMLENTVSNPDELPVADPYSYRAPFYIEGFPGRIEPESKTNLIQTLAGARFPSLAEARDALRKFESGAVEPTDYSYALEPHILSVVWTPRREKGDEGPDYFQIFDIFLDLMHWRGLLFGRRSMSSYTSSLTVDLFTHELGQTWIE